jgi:hypothetical protein
LVSDGPTVVGPSRVSTRITALAGGKKDRSSLVDADGRRPGCELFEQHAGDSLALLGDRDRGLGAPELAEVQVALDSGRHPARANAAIARQL